MGEMHPFLNTPEGELALLRSLITHRPFGDSKHFAMVGILSSLHDAFSQPAPSSDGRASGELDAASVWEKLKEYYREPLPPEMADDEDEERQSNAQAGPSGMTGSDFLSAANQTNLEDLTDEQSSLYALIASRGARNEDKPPSPEAGPLHYVPLPKKGSPTKKRKASPKKGKALEGDDSDSLTDLEDGGEATGEAANGEEEQAERAEAEEEDNEDMESRTATAMSPSVPPSVADVEEEDTTSRRRPKTRGRASASTDVTLSAVKAANKRRARSGSVSTTATEPEKPATRSTRGKKASGRAAPKKKKR